MTSGRQPFLHDAVVAVWAPTQMWSRPSGDLEAASDGIFHGDRRFVSGMRLTVAGDRVEPLDLAVISVDRVTFDAAVRQIDDATPDPHVRLTRERRVSAAHIHETITLRSVVSEHLATEVEIALVPDFSSLSDVKAGSAPPQSWGASEDGHGVEVSHGTSKLLVTAPGARIVAEGEQLRIRWPISLGPGDVSTIAWSIELTDPTLVVRAADPAPPRALPTATSNHRLNRWTERALDDLSGLRLALPEHPADAFLAAGAPWFLTLFGRDSLWAARLLLPLDLELAGSTLRVLARLQGVKNDPATEEEPGKILHELRSSTLRLPGEGIVLPPRYYGTIDATALWILLLVEADNAGLDERETAALLPHLRAACEWMVNAAPPDGFIAYSDRTGGHGLANQGWKDSGDSIQWRDGALADGPIALCEVQGYAYAAATGAAELLDRFDQPGGEDLRGWAAALRERFRERFWVTTPEGHYPAIALDRDGAAVDSLTSNIGHLLGTGILDANEARDVADLLVSDSMSAGFGVRTLSSGARGFWPLSYHAGAVWSHDSAIIAWGMHRAGLDDHAMVIVNQLARAAEAFDYRMPELYAGDAAADRPRPSPYPAACRPQAWSAAAAVTASAIARAVSA